MVRATDFARKRPVIGRDKIPGDLIWRQLEQIYQVRGTTYEAAAAMTELFIPCCPCLFTMRKKKRKMTSGRFMWSVQRIILHQLLLSDHSGGCSGLYGNQQKLSLSRISSISEAVPKEYLTEYRIRQACHLLRETGLSVASIAYSVGFEDNLYFSKAFKKKMQMSPSQYRKHHMP